MRQQERVRWLELKADFFECLPCCRFGKRGIARLSAPAGHGDVSRPRIAYAMGSPHEKKVESTFAGTEHCGNGSGLRFPPNAGRADARNAVWTRKPFSKLLNLRFSVKTHDASDSAMHRNEVGAKPLNQRNRLMIRTR